MPGVGKGTIVTPEYCRPTDLNQATAYMNDHTGETTILAGGTDVMVDMRSGALTPRRLLDVSRLSELKRIDIVDGNLIVGAGVTLSEIRSSDLIRTHAPTLRKCAETFASEQIRNVATIGGNVAHCSPCGDTLPPLLIHEARAVMIGAKGEREIPVSEIASGPYTCALPRDEIIVRFILKPAGSVNYFDFQKIGRRRALAIARISMAAMARSDGDGRIEFLRIALGSCTPVPRRMAEVETFLTGKRPDEGMLLAAAKQVSDRMIETTGRRASAVYKEPAVQGLFLRLLLPLIRDDMRP